ncbi:helix-turn-helix domain-containing protein [[Mycobacterium] kokjensenii]|uniref:Helix-turn-helix domain-containing protein n=1 Tax=[Mycobacterium] kokjensenii TaxID=3064287 RepID=A0ABM9L918_9MYCO|nr:helix-turn-helix domain-containing protein [Mycolicibacter sp. MU0083]CAJ1494949.1 helix-turn-helix domain-containing protein [Mycolicibacter sp. MU0083]
MVEPSYEDVTGVAQSAAATIAKLENRFGEIARAVQQRVMDEIAEMRDDIPLLDLLQASVEQNVDAVLSAIQYGIPIQQIEPPSAALEHARRLAQRGVSVNVLIRAYRFGQQTLLDVVLDQIRIAEPDPERSLAVYQQITATTFGYIDRISQEVIAVYQNERDRWLETQNSARALRVRELLDSDTVDDGEQSAAIGYPLDRLHLAVVVWWREPYVADGMVRMDRFVRALSEFVGRQDRPLFVAADRMTGWGWIPLAADASSDAVVARARAFAKAQHHAPLLAIGDPLSGLDGFRRSHRRAVAASAVAIAAGPHAETVVANNDPGLSAAALLGSNVEAAQEWVGEVLGPLAGATDSDERLRETLRVFLHAGSSYKAAARQLDLHFNSVKYRVARAEERRGRPIVDDRLEVELALLLCRWFRNAVLQ